MTYDRLTSQTLPVLVKLFGTNPYTVPKSLEIHPVG